MSEVTFLKDTLAKALIGDFSSRQCIASVDSAHLDLSLGQFPQRGRTRARCAMCS